MMPSYDSIPQSVDLPLPPPSTKPANDQKVLATPFSLEYRSDIIQLRFLQEWYSDELHAALAAQMTMKHLKTFVDDQFRSTFGVDLKRFGSTYTIIKSSSTVPVIAYAVDITFAGATSAFIPSLNEVDLIIELAFRKPAVLSLIRDLQELPEEVPFHDTQSVVYKMPEGSQGVVEENDSLLSPASFGVIVGGCAMISFMACCFFARHRSRMRCARARAATSRSHLRRAKEDGMEILMPSHSYCDSFLEGSRNSSNNYINDGTFHDSITGSCTGSSRSKQSRSFGRLSTASIVSETHKIYANLRATNSSSRASSNAGAWDERYDIWSIPPSSPGPRSIVDCEGESMSLVSSVSPASIVIDDGESNFDPPSSPRVPCDPPASRQPQNYSSDLNIRVI